MVVRLRPDRTAISALSSYDHGLIVSPLGPHRISIRPLSSGGEAVEAHEYGREICVLPVFQSDHQALIVRYRSSQTLLTCLRMTQKVIEIDRNVLFFVYLGTAER